MAILIELRCFILGGLGFFHSRIRFTLETTQFGELVKYVPANYRKVTFSPDVAGFLMLQILTTCVIA